MRNKAITRERSVLGCVYQALSIHPVLNSMKMPADILVNFDWHVGLGPSNHFWHTLQIGEQGQQARIMILLCWVIGHWLLEDKVRTLVINAVEDAIATVKTSSRHLDSILQFYWVKKVLEQLAIMIKMRLPAANDRNSFYSRYFIASLEDEPIPHVKLWVYCEEYGRG
jgi:hypothetical protein